MAALAHASASRLLVRGTQLALMKHVAGSQIRHYYHRLLKKVNHLLAPLTECVDAYDTDDVRLALLSWCAFLHHLAHDSPCDGRSYTQPTHALALAFCTAHA